MSMNRRKLVIATCGHQDTKRHTERRGKNPDHKKAA
jgi:hypothetical protein